MSDASGPIYHDSWYPLSEDWTMAEVELIITRGDPETLLYVPIVVSMDPPDCRWAEAICLQLASHSHPNVRGNAVLSLGHLARTCRRLDKSRAFLVIKAALEDEDPYVRGQADSAAGDVRNYLGWWVR